MPARSQMQTTRAHVDGFDWDSDNIDKNWRKHRVHSSESEEVFFNEPYYLTEDAGH
jgi:uncharacterized DUF497 family protein